VWDVAVVGMEDERFGERPVAFVVPVHGTDVSTLRAALGLQVQATLGRLKHPDALHFIPELPRSPTGKLLRRRLRDLVPSAGA
jgi:acyl-coenzyme A synthetase/AMP-(fatty) acid ligase